MCGITGIFYPEGNRTPERRVLEAMTRQLRHRGPDGTGIYLDGPMGFGSTRLAIIDPAPRAAQPMVLNSGDYAITFNGEIYNYIELRNDLEREGVRFITTSDTEVLLRLYIRRGTACLGLLRGMFAFAIWDRRKGELFLARDVAGEKPLVYCCLNGMFAFASEIKGLLAHPGIPREIDPLGLHTGLFYWIAPAPFTAFRHIRKLGPAEHLVISREGVRTGRYWHLTFDPDRRIRDPQEAASEVRSCLQDTVRIMRRSDVPVGAMLSGGIDSSAIVALTGRQEPPIDTFCISYDTPERDQEFRAARAVAERYGTNHHEITFTSAMLSEAPAAVRCFDEPFSTFMPLHAMVISRSISAHVKVAFTGNGGDELFGGYADHRLMLRMDRHAAVWRSLGRLGLSPLLRPLLPASLRRSFGRYEHISSLPPERVMADLSKGAVGQFTGSIYSDRMFREIAGTDPRDLLADAYTACHADNQFDGFLHQQLAVNSQHSIVQIPDIAGMAYSLEYRSPFLDRKMIELSARIPASLKVSLRRGAAGGKLVLRQALRDRLPPWVLDREKTGYGSQIPYDTFMVREWAPFVRDRLAGGKLADSGLFRTSALLALHESACNGRPRFPLEMLWGVAMIGQWLEEYF